MTGPVSTPEPGAIVFIEDPYATGFTDEEIDTLLNGGVLPPITIRPLTGPGLTAAADVMTGAMIAFIPRTEDIQRLLIEGGEPAEQIHCTSIYLGDAVDFADDERQMIIELIQEIAPNVPPILANVFGFAVLNPGGPEPCLVANVGGIELAAAQEAIEDIAESVDTADQHAPWLAHITLIYEDDPRKSMTDDLMAQAGPLIFDRIRVAFAGDVTDIPLGDSLSSAAVLDQFHLAGKHNQATHGHGLSQHASIREVQMGEKLNSGKRLDLSNPEEHQLAVGIAGWTQGGHDGLQEHELAGTGKYTTEHAIGKYVANGGVDSDHIPSEQPIFSFARTVAAAPANGPELHRGMHDVHPEDLPNKNDVFDFAPTSFTRSKKQRDKFATPRGGPDAESNHIVHYKLREGNRSLRIDKEAGSYSHEEEHVFMGRVRVVSRKDSEITIKNVDGKKGKYPLTEIELEMVSFETPTTRYEGGKATRTISSSDLWG